MTGQLIALRALFAKDVRLLWPLMLLCMVLFLALALLPPETGVIHRIIGTLSTCANLILIVAVIHNDAPSNIRMDWLTRPIAPAMLLAEKLGFLFVALLLPSLMGELLGHLMAGGTVDVALPMTVTGHFMAMAMALPIMAAAALTTRMVETGILALAVAALNAAAVPVMLMLTGQAPDAVGEQTLAPMIQQLAALTMAGSAVTLWLIYGARRRWAAQLAFGITPLLSAAVQMGFILKI